MARRRRRSTSYSPSRRRSLSYPTAPKRTPTLVYLVLALLCLGGLFYSKQNLVKTVSGTVLDAYSGQPLVGVNVSLTNDKQQSKTASIPETAKALTDNSGKFEFAQATDNYSLLAQVSNYRSVQLKPTGVYTSEIKLVPTLLRGQVKSEKGQPVARAAITFGTRTVETSNDGSFSFADAPESGTLSIRAAGFRRSTFSYDKTIRLELTIQSITVKAAYIAPADIASPSAFNTVMTPLASSGVTAVVVDLKDESGKVLFDSGIPLAASAGAGNDKRIPNLPNLLKTFQDKKLYTIARIVCFQDPVLTDLKPEWTLMNRATGKPWTDAGGFNWINPYQREAWDYYLGLAEEAARAGFDEVQFAGLNFPFVGKLTDIDYRLPEGKTSNANTRMEAITGFLKAARDRLSPLGVYTSVTVFGSSLIESGDLGIGMNVQLMAAQTDYISPIIYPVEWEPGAFGIDKPLNKPYELVKQTMLSAQSRLQERLPQVRPWLQDFSRNSVTYGENEIRDEIRAVEELQAGNGTGWILYNPASRYNLGAVPARP